MLIVVPGDAGAGNAADVVPRLVFDRLAAELGQPIVIENRVGAEALPMTPAEMDDLVKRETVANMEVIKAPGIKQ